MAAETSAAHPHQWRVGVVAGMASYIDAAALVATGIALAIYQGALGLTPGEIGVLSGALTLSVAVGAVVGGRLGDRLGRRRVFLATMMLVIAGAVLATVGTGFAVLLAGVVFIGLGVGGDLPVSLATIAETADDENRGKLIVFSQVLWVAGILVSIGIASFFGNLGRPGGQLLFGQVGAVALVVLIARLAIPESTLWLEGKRRRDAGELDDTPTVRVRDLLRAPYGKPLVALLLFYGLTNLGANTTGQFNTFIAVNVAGTDVETFNRWALIALVISFVPGLWFMKVVDSGKRMVYFAVGAVLVVASYVYLAVVGFSLVSMVVALLLAVIGNAWAFEGIMKVWSQESFPTMLRSTAQGTIVAVARVSAALLATVTPALLQAGARATFVGLAVITGIGYLVGGLVFGRSARNEFQVEPLAQDVQAARA